MPLEEKLTRERVIKIITTPLPEVTDMVPLIGCDPGWGVWTEGSRPEGYNRSGINNRQAEDPRFRPSFCWVSGERQAIASTKAKEAVPPAPLGSSPG
ncbi:unnamed protein product [Rangifer tarandus platyrhynchus]|uniref:Uncharacterized protein n=2 Tax=Rangifer tarandus platyrhynchus TaxID=3082113 RepID=A0ABN8ZHA3_RANTA|nr:unnamed protein product [Rangifer tarandus platyrhynchus]CAI9707412.1 unnamed protein product [Rangifer tarandus platyrhynchus]